MSPKAGGPTEVRNQHARGGIALHALFVVITFAILAVAVVFIVRRHQSRLDADRRVALQICEDGLLVALERISASPSGSAAVARTSHRGGWYEVEQERDGQSGLRLVARGSSGIATREQVCVLTLSVDKSESTWVQKSISER